MSQKQSMFVRFLPALAIMVLATVLTPRPALAQDGDLSWDYSCNAWMSGPVNMAVELEVWNDYDDFSAYDWKEGYSWVEASGGGVVPARIVGQSASCAAWYYVDACWYCYENELDALSDGPPAELPELRWGWELVDWNEWSTYYDSAGPGNVAVVAKGFIPFNWVTDPHFPIMIIYSGDNRGFDISGDARVTFTGDVANSAVDNRNWIFGPDVGTGMTAMYERATSLPPPWPGTGEITSEARSDWEPGAPLKMAWGFATPVSSGCTSFERLGSQFGANTSSVRIHCNAEASDPLVFGSWLATARINFWLTLTFGNGGAYYNLSGCHKPFPSHEVYLNGSAVLQAESSQDLDDLLGPLPLIMNSCTSTFTKTGNVGGL